MNKTSIIDIRHYIEREVFYITDTRMDGYTTWGRKQQLYELKFYLDDMLKKCPKYAVEDEWLEEQHMIKVQRILEGKVKPRG